MKTRIRLPLFAALAWLATNSALAQTSSPESTNALGVPGYAVVLPARMSDPIESWNRDVWGFNKGFATWFVKPLSRGYRYVVIKPIRTGIRNGGKNLKYPGRLLNNLLQGKWEAANEESERLFVNTIFGLGGFFDVATKWGIAKHDTSFGETFESWGWKPGCYLMLPIFGPSDERDTGGLIADWGADPLTYFFPYEWVGPSVVANNFTESVDPAVRFSQAEADPYSILQYAWSFSHENKKPDMRVIGDQDEASLETLQSVFVGNTNVEFPNWGKTRSVLIPATGKKLDYTYWLQPGRAPIVYMVPGLGAHRLAGNQLSLAELLFKNGYSCVSISSSFHPDFMEHAATTDLPSYPPTGIHDVHVALTAINHELEQKYPGRLGAKALMGYSMGGFQTLFMAAQAATNQEPLVKFDRFVAIDAPIRLRYCVTNVDDFYAAPLAWPADQRTANIENTLLKVVALSKADPKAGASLPFDAIESKFLIGLSFRLTLRDMIFSSQFRHNQGVLKQPLKKSKRAAAYEEIMQYSLWDYIQKFAGPYDAKRGIDLRDPRVEAEGTSLRTYTAELQANPDIRVIANRNDLFLQEPDLTWIEGTFASSHVHLFDHGGHLGNLAQPEVRSAVLEALDGLKDTPAAAKPVAVR